jgi:hypothetical protein
LQNGTTTLSFATQHAPPKAAGRYAQTPFPQDSGVSNHIARIHRNVAQR